MYNSRDDLDTGNGLDEVVANSRGPRTAGRGAKYRGLPVRGLKTNSRGPRTSGLRLISADLYRGPDLSRDAD